MFYNAPVVLQLAFMDPAPIPDFHFRHLIDAVNQQEIVQQTVIHRADQFSISVGATVSIAVVSVAARVWVAVPMADIPSVIIAAAANNVLVFMIPEPQVFHEP